MKELFTKCDLPSINKEGQITSSGMSSMILHYIDYVIYVYLPQIIKNQ